MIICVAPMMDKTDRHCRYLHRIISPHARLYTEMITTNALLHGDADYHLQFHPHESYVALQLGGCNPQDLATCAKLGENYGYDEINLNVGCPSDRVSAARFGACLMREPNLVADCIFAMRSAVKIPVSVKCRIGVDEYHDYAFLANFIDKISATGCNLFIIHARKAWLSGLSPKENREIPPLNHERVYQLKKDFKHLTIITNGGIQSYDEVVRHIKYVDGCMIGRAAYTNPYLLADIEKNLFYASVKTRQEVIQYFLPYIEDQLKKGCHLKSIARHLLGLFYQQKGARQWRRFLSENAHLANSGPEVIIKAFEYMGGA